MLKSNGLVKEFERRTQAAPRDLIAQLPALDVYKVIAGHRVDNREIDLVFYLRHHADERVVVCELKSLAQPRLVRHFRQQAIPRFLAPYLSPAVRRLCNDEHVGFLDLKGNARIAFDGVYIGREVASRPAAAHRELRSLFKLRAAQVLRVLLRGPGWAWRVTEPAGEAKVRFGHVSNVRNALIDREWAKAGADGLILSEPDALLDACRPVRRSVAAGRLRPGRRLAARAGLARLMFAPDRHTFPTPDL
jgi:hypothetical protein